MLATKLVLANKHVDAAVEIRSSITQMFSKDIFFNPIELKVAEGLAIPETDGREGVLRGQVFLEEAFLGGDWAGTTPEFGNSRVIHPAVEEL